MSPWFLQVVRLWLPIVSIRGVRFLYSGRQFWATTLKLHMLFRSFPWRNLASKAAGVTVSIVGISRRSPQSKKLYLGDTVKQARFIGPYLVPDHDTIVESRREPISGLHSMDFGSMPNDGGHLLLTPAQGRELVAESPASIHFLKKFIGSDDALYGTYRYCLWITDESVTIATQVPAIRQRLQRVESKRSESGRETTRKLGRRPHAFGEIRHRDARSCWCRDTAPRDREYLPFEFVNSDVVVADSAFALPDVELYEAAMFASRMHLVWIATVCGKLETRYRYSNTLGWNTFPVPTLTDKNKADLTAAPRTSCWRVSITSRRRSPTSTTPKQCRTTCARRMSAMTRCWSASTSVVASRTTPSGWRSSLSCIRR